MPAFGHEFALVTQYIRKLRGGSQPILALASDGMFYVVKFSNNLQGPNLLFNESAGSELYSACGLAVPSWKPLLVTDSFLDQNRACWMEDEHGSLRPASGLCFGSRFLSSNGKQLLEFLPGACFKRVRNQASFWLAWLIDVCAAHADNRQAIFAEDAEGWLNAHFVDHGHLFGGPRADLWKNFSVSRYLDPRIYPEVSSKELLNFQSIVRTFDADRLWHRVQAVPDEWKKPSSLGGFVRCLNRLSTPLLLQGILDAMMDCHRQTARLERHEYQPGPTEPSSVLCPGVQNKGLAQRHVAVRVHRPFCVME